MIFFQQVFDQQVHFSSASLNGTEANTTTSGCQLFEKTNCYSMNQYRANYN